MPSAVHTGEPLEQAVGAFGEKLRKQRELRGVSLDAIAGSTKISTRMLRAIEEEHFDQLPGGVFNKGFVRAYARQVGLNEDEAVADYLIALRESQFQSQAILPNFRPAGIPVGVPTGVLAGVPVKTDLAAATTNLPNESAQPAPPQPILDAPASRKTSDRVIEFRPVENRANGAHAVEEQHDADHSLQERHGPDRQGDDRRGGDRRGEDRRLEDRRLEDRRREVGQAPGNVLRAVEVAAPQPLDVPAESPAPAAGMMVPRFGDHGGPGLVEAAVSRGLPRPPWEKLAAGLLLFIVVLALWNYFRHRPQPSAPSTPAVMSSASTPAPAASSVTPLTPNVVANLAATPAPPAFKASSPPKKAAPATTRRNSTLPATVPRVTASTTRVKKTAPAKFTLMIRASQTSWISIVADGQPVARETLIAPANTSIRATREIVVKAGNAAGISFRLNGKEIPAQGNSGEVRSYTFDSSGIRNSVALQ